MTQLMNNLMNIILNIFITLMFLIKIVIINFKITENEKSKIDFGIISTYGDTDPCRVREG